MSSINNVGIGEIIKPEPSKIFKGIRIIGLGVTTCAALAEGIKFFNQTSNIPAISNLLTKLPSTDISIMIGAVAVTTVVASQVLECLCNRPKVVKEYNASKEVDAIVMAKTSMETEEVTVRKTRTITKQQATDLIERFMDVCARHHMCMTKIHAFLHRKELEMKCHSLILTGIVDRAVEMEYKKRHGEYPYRDLPYQERCQRIENEKRELRDTLTRQFYNNDPEADKLISRPEFENKLKTISEEFEPLLEQAGYPYSSRDISYAREVLKEFAKNLRNLSDNHDYFETELTDEILKGIEERFVAPLEAEIREEEEGLQGIKQSRLENFQRARIKGIFGQSDSITDVTEEEKSITFEELIQRCRDSLAKNRQSSDITNEQVFHIIGVANRANNNNNNNNNR